MRVRPLCEFFQVGDRFRRSVNIAADYDDPQALDDYILTPLGKTVLARVVGGLTGNSRERAWSITGPYGAGKSACALFMARLLGYRIVWTVHDLLPTRPIEPHWIERLARYAIAWLAHDVIVHCEEARRLVRRSFRRSRRVWVLPLPSYADAHPNEISQAQARTCLGIAQDQFVVGFIGGIWPNNEEYFPEAAE